MSSVNPPVFIVGMPRSGTTLLSNLLNATKEIYFPEETHYYQQLDKLKTKKNNNLYLDFLNSEINQYLVGFNLTKQELADLIIKMSNLEKPFPRSFLLRELCMLKLAGKSAERWGEKTPIHFKYLKEILDDFEDSKIINIIRDPRDVMSSMRAAKWNKFFDLKRRLTEYKYNILVCTNSSYSSNVLNIKYEDLVCHPEKTLSDICAFINIKFSSDVIQKFYQQDNLNFNISNEPWKKNNSKPLDAKNVFKWKFNPNSFENKFVNWYCRLEIKKLGYEGLNYPNFISRTLYLLYITLYNLAFKIK
jgi:hypothetical protein